jgi:hypothetical protein
VTAPVLSDFTVTAVTTTTAALSVRSDTKNGTMYFVVIPNAATTPNATQIIAGTDGDDVAASWAGSLLVASIDAYRPGPTGLTNGAAYKACAAHQNSSAENSNVVTGTFTGGSTDSTAPVLSSFTVGSIGTSTALLTVTTDEGNGTIFWTVVQAADTQPTSAQVIAGLNGSGEPADFSAASNISSTGAKTKLSTGILSDTSYLAYAVHRDASGNISNKVSGGFSTSESVTISYAVSGNRSRPVFVVDTDSGGHFFGNALILENTTPATSTRSWIASGNRDRPICFNDSVIARQQTLSSIFIR